MGGICSRKRNQQVNNDGIRIAASGRYKRSGSSKWLLGSFSRPATDILSAGSCPSLVRLCVHKICQEIDKYTSFSMLPRDLTQQIFNELVMSHCLTDSGLEAFIDCSLQIVDLFERWDIFLMSYTYTPFFCGLFLGRIFFWVNIPESRIAGWKLYLHKGYLYFLLIFLILMLLMLVWVF